MDIHQMLVAAGVGALAGGLSAALTHAVLRLFRGRSTDGRKKGSSLPVVVAVVAAVAAAQGFRHSKRSHPRAEVAGVQVDIAPEVAAWARDQEKAGRSKEDVQKLSAELAMRGIKRLDPAGLEARAGTMKALFDAARSPAECAAIVRGASPAVVQSAIERLPLPDRELWIKTSQRAMTAELRQSPGVPLDDKVIEQVMGKILEGIPEAERQRFGEALQSLATAKDEEVCWAAKALYARAFELPQPDRLKAFRVFVEN